MQRTHPPINGYTTVGSAPGNSRVNEQSNQQDVSPRPRKRTRCLRSCLACRKAKQRCQLPDSTVEPSDHPLPLHLACRRCQLLENDCHVVDSVPKTTTGGAKSSSSGSSNNSRHHILSNDRRNRPRDSSLQQIGRPHSLVGHQGSSLSSAEAWKSHEDDIVTSPDTPETKLLGQRQYVRSYSAPYERESREEIERHPSQNEDDRASLSGSAGTPPVVNDLRIFEPAAVQDCKEAAAVTAVTMLNAEGGPASVAGELARPDLVTAQQDQLTPSSKHLTPRPTKNKDWIKVGMTVCRPFELLGYLLRRQSISRHLFAQSERPVSLLMDIVTPVVDLRQRYEEEVDTLQFGMPFIPPFDETWQAGHDADLLLGVMLYLSFRTRQESEGQALILPVLRQHYLSCIIHLPRNVYDVVSLHIAALHLPLLLGALSDANSLDGAGLLNSAASAARVFEFDRAARTLISPEGMAAKIDGRTVRHACLWTSLSLHTAFVALAGDVERHPLVQCTRQDLDALQMYSDTVASSPAAAQSINIRRQCASISLLIFRARATAEVREMTQRYAYLMKAEPEEPDRTARAKALHSLITEAMTALQHCSDSLYTLQYPLAVKLSSYGWQRNYSMDVLGLDVALLQLLSMSRFVEMLFYRTPGLIGHEASPTDLLKLLQADAALDKLYTTAGLHRADIARFTISLFANTVRRASSHAKLRNDVASPLLLINSIPAGHLCAAVVMAGQAVTEELDGRMANGEKPNAKVGDASMEVAELMLANVTQALLLLGNLNVTMFGSGLPAGAKEAAQQGNLFILTAKLTDSLTRRVVIWKGVADMPLHSRRQTLRPSLVTTTAATTMNNATKDGGLMESSKDTLDFASSLANFPDMDPMAAPFDLDGFSPEGFEDLFREILSTPIQFT